MKVQPASPEVAANVEQLFHIEATWPEYWLIKRALRRLAADSNAKLAIEAQQLLDKLLTRQSA